MKEVKKLIIGFLTIISFNLVSAYIGNFYSFDFGNLLFSVRDYLPFTLIFLGIFYASNLLFKKLVPRSGWAVALFFSMLVTYGLTYLNFDFTGIFYKIGFTEDFLFNIAPWIVLALFAIALWKWGFCKILIIAGVILIILGITGIGRQGFLLIVLGALLVLFGIWIDRKIEVLKLNAQDRAWYDYLRKNRKNRSGLFKKKSFNYKLGMRRSGLKPTRGRFVSRASVERYARRFGNAAARRRFG